ncbi:uncharacterized protein LOC8281689 [Ricinus communis]|uniref:Uncharacterized protein n=1 Tax=Ricinus communis TaxID=3988 RepID=B9RJP5_RICCO|nr:uncharacterized protein LOC8281689 [Ricinus communis]EEF48547.1 conserved hypothetical protein [Ricinus communis]|eukprot:XP_002513964.1 uncharacterized protein LOC8281689 [Ricinus communis]
MGYLKRSKDSAAVPRTKPDGRCKKHPKHKQSPGVCSICLSEKLSQLSTTSSSSRATSSMDSLSSSSSLSSYSSSSCSSCSSPMHRYRPGHEGKGSFSFLLSGKNVLTRSRSLVFISRTKIRGNKEKVDNDHKIKKTGFWSKLRLRPKNKGMEEGLVHSRTIEERMTMSFSTRVN